MGTQAVVVQYTDLIALRMETELVSETLDLINPLMWPSAYKTFIEFCRRENFKTYINTVMPYWAMNTVCSENIKT
jgi:hypothetical protein